MLPGSPHETTAETNKQSQQSVRKSPAEIKDTSHCSEAITAKNVNLQSKWTTACPLHNNTKKKTQNSFITSSSHTLPVQFVPAQSSTCEILFGFLCHSRSCRCRSERTPSSRPRYPGTPCRLERHGNILCTVILKYLTVGT